MILLVKALVFGVHVGKGSFLFGGGEDQTNMHCGNLDNLDPMNTVMHGFCAEIL